MMMFFFNVFAVIRKFCAACRKVVHTAPRLWSKLTVDGNIKCSVTKGLARSESGCFLKHFSDVWGSRWQWATREGQMYNYTSRDLQYILSFCYKIHGLHLIGQSPIRCPLFSPPQPSFPILESSSLVIIEWDEFARSFPDKIQAFVEPTRLQTVVIAESFESASPLKLFALPVEQSVTSLEISAERSCTDPVVYQDLLCHCKTLTRLSFATSTTLSTVVTCLTSLLYLRSKIWSCVAKIVVVILPPGCAYSQSALHLHCRRYIWGYSVQQLTLRKISRTWL